MQTYQKFTQSFLNQFQRGSKVSALLLHTCHLFLMENKSFENEETLQVLHVCQRHFVNETILDRLFQDVKVAFLHLE